MVVCTNQECDEFDNRKVLFLDGQRLAPAVYDMPHPICSRCDSEMKMEKEANANG